MTHVVEVNECRVLGCNPDAAHWWTIFAITQEKRLTFVKVTLGGAVVHVACDNREHADWLARHFVEFGRLPRGAVKVRRLKEAAT